MDMRQIVGFVFLGLSSAMFFLTLKELTFAFRLKSYGKRAFGRITGVKRLPGRDRNGQCTNAFIIEVKSGNDEFNYDCIHNRVSDFPNGKVPILYLKNKQGRVTSNVDDWYVLLTDAIFYLAIALALTIPFFIVTFTSVKE